MKVFVASKNVCGKFEDAPEESLAIYLRTANNDLSEKQECYLRTLEAKISRYDFDVLNSLIESSSQLLNLIVSTKPTLKKFSDIVPEYDYENAGLTEKVTKFDR